MRDGKMELLETSSPIDVSGWFENAKGETAITEKLRHVFTEEPPILFFQVQFGDHLDDDSLTKCDPVTLCIDLPLTPKGDDMVTFGCSLEDAVDDLIDGFRNFTTGKVEDDPGPKVCTAIAIRLRELADRLEGAMTKEFKWSDDSWKPKAID